MTRDDAYWHTRYEELDPQTHAAVDGAFDAVFKEMEDRGVCHANDDRAEALVAAITRYVIESRR